MTERKVSVIVPVARLNAYVRECIEHLARQTYRNFDVYVVTDEPETLDGVTLPVTLLATGPVTPNEKRNAAAGASDADIVALIDDDAYPTPEWLATAMRHFTDPQVVAAGGPAVTPLEDGPLQQAGGAVFASPLVTAAYTYRYVPGRRRDVEELPACNLLVRRDAFVRYAPDCSDAWPGEDSLLCALLVAGGARIIYDPDARVFHHRRSLFGGHVRQVWRYAVFRGSSFRRSGVLRAAYAVPTAFVIANLAFIPALTSARLRVPALLAAAVYVACVLFEAVRARRTHRANPALVALGIYLTHLTYGTGFAAGAVTRPR